MSYTRSYRESITVHGSRSVTISYPASQSGGSTTRNVDFTEVVPIDVNIHVDTNPFDESVDYCNTNVNLLTGAVVATEVAQIASKDKNSKKVASSIVTGFFSFIRFEISQQISELSQNIDAQLMHHKELAQSCLAKKNQMEGDYLRITGRYAKVFEDLNNELSNRIIELDKPAFTFRKETDNLAIRASHNDLVNTVAIFGSESGNLQSKISASIAKKRAIDTLSKAKIFLWQQRKLNTTIQQNMQNENVSDSKYIPVCFIETNNEKSQITKNLYFSNYLTALQDNFPKNQLVEKFSHISGIWHAMPKEYQEKIGLYFNAELNNPLASNDKHSQRVKEMIKEIAKLGSINTISFQNI